MQRNASQCNAIWTQYNAMHYTAARCNAMQMHNANTHALAMQLQCATNNHGTGKSNGQRHNHIWKAKQK